MEINVEDLIAKATAGDAGAQYQLGNIFQEGLHGQARDIEEAIRWYQQAAEQDHIDAVFNLGLIGIRVLPNMGQAARSDMAVKALKKACKLGDAQACCLLAECFITGEGGVPIEKEQGQKLLEKTAIGGSTLAMNKIGQFLMDGKHLPVDQRRATAWFKKAAQTKDPAGRYNLAINLTHGYGIEVNEEMARKLFLAASKSGHLSAKYNYAAMLLTGLGGVADVEEGNRLLFEAAEQGDAGAQFEAGQACRMGRGVPQDEVAAARWYSLAAAQDHPEALFCMGMNTEHGLGMPQDPVAAEQYYTRAAMENHGGAAHNLAIMYVQGAGIPQDLDLARELFEFAISLGEDDALFSMGLFEANSGNPEVGLMWGILSQQARPDGNAPALIEHCKSQISEAQIAAAETAASNWERPNKTMAFHVRRAH